MTEPVDDPTASEAEWAALFERAESFAVEEAAIVEALAGRREGSP